MPQGDASQYPILPISLSVMAICFLVSLFISVLADYLYDFYLVKFAKTDQKTMIENRVKSDIKRLKLLLQSQKLEKFDPDQAKDRLTIITNLFMEKINSKENKLLLSQGFSKKEQVVSQEKTIKEVPKKVEETKKKDEVKKVPEKPPVKIIEEKTVVKKPEATVKVEKEKSEKKVVILDAKPEKPREELKKEPTVIREPSKTVILNPTPISKSTEIPRPKPVSYESKGERVILAQETTIEDVIKKLSLAPRSATVLIEIRENKVRESSAKDNRGPFIKFTPPSTIGNDGANDSTELKFLNETLEMNHKPNGLNKMNTNPNINKQNDDLMLELLNRKSSFNQSLTRTFRESQSKMIQERLKADADFRRTRHTPPARRRKLEETKAFKYDDDDNEDYESRKSVTKLVFE